MTRQLTPMQTAILHAVQLIPSGKVASYGQIAALIGMPRAARQVGWAMASMAQVPDFPWWRVLNAKGIITIKNDDPSAKELQASLLQEEGIPVHDFSLPMEPHQFRPSKVQIEGLQLEATYRRHLLDRYDLE